MVIRGVRNALTSSLIRQYCSESEEVMSTNSLEVEPVPPGTKSQLRRYIPVCLYTRVYNKRNPVREVLERFVNPVEAALILIADDLQAYSRINRGFPEAIAVRNARAQGDNLRKMFSREIKNLHLEDKAIVLLWRDITGRDDYKSLLQGISLAFRQRNDLLKLGGDFIDYHLKQLRSQRNRISNEWEARYLIEEVTMSIFVTECLGYSHELWELPPKWNEPDPLSYLYRSCDELLLELIGKTHLDRKLEFLPLKELSSISS